MSKVRLRFIIIIIIVRVRLWLWLWFRVIFWAFSMLMMVVVGLGSLAWWTCNSKFWFFLFQFFFIIFIFFCFFCLIQFVVSPVHSLVLLLLALGCPSGWRWRIRLLTLTQWESRLRVCWFVKVFRWILWLRLRGGSSSGSLMFGAQHQRNIASYFFFRTERTNHRSEKLLDVGQLVKIRIVRIIA